MTTPIIASIPDDADYNRTTKTITSSALSHSVNDVYVLGHLAYETDEYGNVLATFTYDSMGVPVSVQVGRDPNASTRYYYVYNGHGDVVALVDAQGNVVASYNYDAFGQLTAFSEHFGTTVWTNPYRYDGREGVRYDGKTGHYWMSVQAYDSALGRFLSRDPLGQVPLFFADQPYVYGGNNPSSNNDPSGQATGWQTLQGQDCVGRQHCVIFVGGIDVGWPRQEASYQNDMAFWFSWHEKLNSAFKGSVGFIYFEAPDARQGAYRLNIYLQRLNRWGFKGRISGAAAIFMYLAGSAFGTYGVVASLRASWRWMRLVGPL